MRTFKLIATFLLITAVSLAKYYQPGDEVVEKLLQLELRRDAYKYGQHPNAVTDENGFQVTYKSEPEATEEAEGAVIKMIEGSQKVYQARAAFIAYALKNGYDSEYMVYFLMWIAASFSVIAILSWINKLAGKRDEKQVIDHLDEVIKQQLVGEL